ncbi:MAG: hypothetical protein ACM32O_07415 [Clostridia bacterium]
MSGTSPEREASSESVRELLRECILYGIFFKAVASDVELFRSIASRISYLPLLEDVSAWAERVHYRLKRQLHQLGVEVLTTQKQGPMYKVEIRMNGYRREAIYSIELLRAECQEKLKGLLARHAEEQGRKGNEA